ncbi:MAG: DMT family transporter [Rhodobacteraceae bacterium]|nr:DMT family transporter [Paracoccaceae bacterium]
MERRFGALLVLASCLPFALAGIFTRLVTADLWTLLAWRGLVGGAAITLYALRVEGRAPMGRTGWTLALVGAAASVCYLGAFRLAPVAHVALIYALAPFAAAGLALVTGGQTGGRGVLAAACISLAGVALVAGGGGGAHWAGDALALCMTLLMALTAVIIRARPRAPVLRAMAASALPLAATGLVLGDPWSVSTRDAILMTAFAATFALAVILLTEGAKRLPAAQVTLLGGAEVPLAVALGVVLLGEIPPPTTLVGGALVLVAVLWQARVEMRAGCDLSEKNRRADRAMVMDPTPNHDFPNITDRSGICPAKPRTWPRPHRVRQ